MTTMRRASSSKVAANSNTALGTTHVPASTQPRRPARAPGREACRHASRSRSRLWPRTAPSTVRGQPARAWSPRRRLVPARDHASSEVACVSREPIRPEQCRRRGARPRGFRRMDAREVRGRSGSRRGARPREFGGWMRLKCVAARALVTFEVSLIRAGAPA